MNNEVKGEIFAYYQYPEPNGREYFRDDFINSGTVIEVFDYCQIWLAYITKPGWEFLVDYYGYEMLYNMNAASDWIDCATVDEYKVAVAYYMSIAV